MPNSANHPVFQPHDSFPAELQGRVLAIGNFDGVHLGHASVVALTVALAASLEARPGVMTFEPHPRSFFQPDKPVFRLSDMALKADRLQELGINGVLALDFNAELAALSAEAFLDDLLIRRLRVAGLVVGEDFRFGQRRTGNLDLLKSRLDERVVVAPPFRLEDEIVSSSKIRSALEAGNITLATKLLGRPWRLRGEVRHGDKRGRELGFPTANMWLAGDCRLAHGIYAVRMRVDGTWRDGVASYGRRPTFDNGAPRIETFLFDFSGDLYGKTVDLDLISWIRPELKFDGMEPLIAQMNRDAAEARRLLRR
ncbi:MAG: bifunctional riboflavin kinase/FAD synthetase [Bosea sp. (in: a-proteobacteria)]